MLALAGFTNATDTLLPEKIPEGIEIDVFYAEECKHCKKVEEEFFKPLEDRGVRITRYEVSRTQSAKALLSIRKLPEFEAVSIDSNGDLPLVFAGRWAFEGEDAVLKNLPRVLVSGDPVLKTAPHVRASSLARDKGPGAVEGIGDGPEIHLAYFENPGCANCGVANLLLSALQVSDPRIVITRFDIGNREDKLLLETIGERVGVPGERRLVTPAIFVGEDFLLERFDGAGRSGPSLVYAERMRVVGAARAPANGCEARTKFRGR